jgi:hypothetical protein
MFSSSRESFREGFVADGSMNPASKHGRHAPRRAGKSVFQNPNPVTVKCLFSPPSLFTKSPLISFQKKANLRA